VGADAWCSNGVAMFMLSARGVFAVTPGDAPTLFTAATPTLRGTDADALMAFDYDADGVHIYSAVDGDWFLDAEARAAWPVSIPSAMRPVAAAHVMAESRNVTALLGADGRWRHFDEDAATDDGTAVASHVALGPLRLSADDAHDGFLAELHAATAQGSAAVTATVYTGRTAEEAVKAAQSGEGGAAFDLVGGYNAVWRPRVRGAWGVAVISSTGRWAYESMLAVMRHTGRLRP